MHLQEPEPHPLIIRCTNECTLKIPPQSLAERLGSIISIDFATISDELNTTIPEPLSNASPRCPTTPLQSRRNALLAVRFPIHVEITTTYLSPRYHPWTVLHDQH